MTAIAGGAGSDSSVTIEVANVSKTFRKHSEPAKTLKERLLTLRGSTVEDFHALRNIDFQVTAGETFGILGHNGSGKSTLLKCIAGTLRPTAGVVRVRGRLSALLELGAGFHPDLTGRENVYLNGSILGFSKTGIDRIFDEIVDFAGLEDFIDTQVKHYSSGMYARLGFAVAVNLDPDVLLIDEVLAVGDEAFQRKCLQRVRGFQNEGRTICLVTHSPEQVRDLCNTALVLDHGNPIHLGDVHEAVSVYRRSIGEADLVLDSDGNEIVRRIAESPVSIIDATVASPNSSREDFRVGDRLNVDLRVAVERPVPVRAHLWIHRNDGLLLVDVSSYALVGEDPMATPGEGHLVFTIDDLPFADGDYVVTVALQAPADASDYDRTPPELGFRVHTGRVLPGPMAIDVSFDTSLVHSRMPLGS